MTPRTSSPGSLTIAPPHGLAPAPTPGPRLREETPTHSLAIVLQAVRAMARWWRWATLAGLILAGAGAAAVWATFEREYRAVALLQIQEAPTHLAYPTQDDSRRYVQNQIELLKSPLVLGPVVSDPEVAALPELLPEADPAAWVARRLRVVNVGNSELFEVSFDNPDGARAAALVNAVVKEYLALRNEHDSSRNQRMLELLDEEKELRAQEVTRLREHVRDLSREISGKDPFTGQATAEVVVLSHPLQALVTQLTTTEVDRRMLEVQVESYRRTVDAQGDREAIPPALVTAAVDRHPELLELKALLSSKTAMLDRIEEASVHGQNDPAYKRIQREVQRLEQSVERTQGSLRGRIAAEMAANLALQRDEELTTMEQTLAATRAAEELLREQYLERSKSLGESGSQSLELEFAKAELAREERVFELIAQRALALRTEARAPARVTLMRSAETPTAPVQAYPFKKLLLALAAGFCAPFGLAVLWERWVKRIADAEQLDQQTTIRVVGEVARLPGRSALVSELTQHDMALFEESVDSLRTCLVFGEGNEAMRVIAVASAVSGEGKTSVAAQLAVSLARSTGERTLIIDADLRSPDVHAVFQIANDVGLATILEGEGTLDDCVNTGWSEFVQVLPAGRAATNPHRLVNSARFHELLAAARQRYRHIIIDTPPILLASEALVIAHAADGTLLCTMRDHSREQQVNSAVARLHAVGARTLGAVLSGIPARQYTAKYGGYAYAD